MIRPVRILLRGLCDAVLPQTCVICGECIPAGTPPACVPCRAELAAIERVSYCPRCGRTMRPVSLHADGCARCTPEPFWNLAGVIRVGAYEPPLRRLLTGLKYRGRERNADFLAELLAAALARRGLLGKLDGLVPVPMSRLRRWQRPCDHVDVLATALSRRVGVPMLRAVRRPKHSPSQTRISSRAQRFENVRGCFALAGGAGAQVSGKRVCIVDNLLATGATTHEVSKILRQAGAKPIYVVVVSRAVLAGDVQAVSAGSPGEPAHQAPATPAD